MTYYDSFDCKINCEEVSPVSAEEQEEVLHLVAAESEARRDTESNLESLEPTERQAALEQAAFEAVEGPRKAGKWNRRDDREIRVGGISI